MIKTAVILAAGLGSRLKEKTESKPKGFLDIEGKTLIQRSIDNLFRNGIEKIYIGSGYLSQYYEELAKKYIEIECIKSDKYNSTSSMYTLYNMRRNIKEDFLLLESDLLYENDALKTLLSDDKKNVILSSGATNSGDEVYIEVDEDRNLINMSKSKDGLKSIDSELVGISKISYSKYQEMNACFVKQFDKNSKADYEYIMVDTIEITKFYVKKLDNLLWCEIDDENHLNRAINIILPRIKTKDKMNKLI